jgi:hypothetical protein
MCLPGTCLRSRERTAINLFVREMPRLSVDLDLVYVNYTTPRNKALEEIAEALQSMAARLEKAGLSVRRVGNNETGDTKLVVDDGASMARIEVNTVLRGTMHPVEARPLVRSAADLFSAELRVPVLSLPELYGGKLGAAGDPQSGGDGQRAQPAFCGDPSRRGRPSHLRRDLLCTGRDGMEQSDIDCPLDSPVGVRRSRIKTGLRSSRWGC